MPSSTSKPRHQLARSKSFKKSCAPHNKQPSNSRLALHRHKSVFKPVFVCVCILKTKSLKVQREKKVYKDVE